MAAPTSEPWLLATKPSDTVRVTIADVARLAGVNKGTASRALRGLPGVGAGTRARVMAAAETLNYSASHIATALATGQSQTVGIVLPTLRSWYFSEVAAGASEVLIPAGFRVELINLDLDPDFISLDSKGFHRLFVEFSGRRGWEALLFASTMRLDAVAAGGAGAMSPLEQTLDTVPGVAIDNRWGGTLAAQHLVELGHREMVILDGRVPGKPEVTTWEHRTLGFLDGTRAARLPEPSVIMAGDASPEHGERAAARLLDADRVPTAIFCHTDELAFGVMAALRRRGVHCPEEVSVVGFDDHPMSRLWDLTTVSQHAYDQGIRAGLALIASLGRAGAAPTRRDDLGQPLEVDLVVRASTAAAAR